MQQTNQTNQEVQLEPQPKSSKTLLIVIIAILITAIVVGLVMYFVMAKTSNNKIELQKKIESLEKQILSQKGQGEGGIYKKENDESDDWQIYHDKTYGFSFEYPQEWLTNKNDNEIVLQSADDKQSIHIKILLNYEGSLEDWKNTQASSEVLTSEKDILVDGIEAKSIEYFGMLPWYGATGVKYNGNLYQIIIFDNGLDNIYNQILSTLKFTD